MGIPYIYGKYARLLLKGTAVGSNLIVLTFDDGPGDRLTTAIMDLLDNNKAKASFFLLGRNIAGRENMVRQIAQRGHEICSHGFDHLNYLKVSPFRALADIKKGWDTIDSALELKQKKYPFRPPYGKLNIICLMYLLIKRVPIVYWTDDSGDTWKSKPQSDRIAILATNAGGTVSLAHDFNRPDEKAERLVLESVRLALAAAKEKGMRILTISELLNGTK